MRVKLKHLRALFAAVFLAFHALPAIAQAGPAPGPTYADIAQLADSAGLVLRVTVLKTLPVEAARAPGLRPGYGRYYVEAKTKALLAGSAPIGESVKYLADLPLDARGKPSRLKKQDVFLFARTVPGRPGELQLVSPAAQQPWSAAGEERLRGILKALVAPDAPAKVTGVRELLYVPGNLAGQGETQIFLSTADSSAASITVRHQPGTPAAWGVSFSELVADVGHPPAHDTLEWYRLACFLPNLLPAGISVSEGHAAQQQAEADYRMVLGDLGVCERNLP